MDNLDVLEILLIIAVFVFGLVVGLLINNLRKNRFRRFPPEALSAVKRYPTYTPPKRRPSYSELFPPVEEIVSPAILFDESELKEETRSTGGAWVCPKCGAADASLIHRKGCNKCYDG